LSAVPSVELRPQLEERGNNLGCVGIALHLTLSVEKRGWAGIPERHPGGIPLGEPSRAVQRSILSLLGNRVQRIEATGRKRVPGRGEV
jgi:hypothetical protein